MAMAASTARGLAAVAMAPCDQAEAVLLSEDVVVGAVQPLNTTLNVRVNTARILKVIRSLLGQPYFRSISAQSQFKVSSKSVEGRLSVV
jgi:hypothetical protein